MTPELRAMLDVASGWAETTMLRDGKLRSPLWHAISAKGEHLIIPAPAPDANLCMVLIRAAFELYGVVRYVSVFEAWDLQKDGGDKQGLEELRRAVRTRGISEHPDRKDIVAFTGEDAGGGMIFARRFVLPGGRRLGPIEITNDGTAHAEGRMVGLLPRGEKTVQ